MEGLDINIKALENLLKTKDDESSEEDEVNYLNMIYLI
jgi:hypothetical protein